MRLVIWLSVEDLEKARGKKDAIGTVRNGRKKIAEGKWVPVKTGRTSVAKTLAKDSDIKQSLKSKPYTQDEIDEIVESYGKRAVGMGREVPIKSIPELNVLLDHSNFAMISTGRNPNMADHANLSNSEVAQRFKNLKKDLKDKGYQFTVTKGKYEGAEESIFIMAHDADRKELAELGNKYEQDSVLLVNKGKSELLMTIGPDKGKVTMSGSGHGFVPDAPDYYTIVSVAGRKVKFQMNLE